MKHNSTILGLTAQTSIHAGTGQNTGVIDLPIQREGHNGWPCVFGSAIKGAMRANAEQHFGKEGTASINIIFGPDSDSADVNSYASAVMISDARLVLFPVRSLSSQFKWVTCPAALERLKLDRQRFGLDDIAIETVAPQEMQAITHNEPANNTSHDLYLEEYRLRVDPQNLDNVLALLKPLIASNYTQTQLAQQLVIVSNDTFSYLVQHATPVNAHIAIESETKTVKDGALWYEETLPPETILYIGITASQARHPDQSASWSATRILNVALSLFKEHPWLQIGGNATVGMGWCAVCNVRAQSQEQA